MPVYYFFSNWDIKEKIYLYSNSKKTKKCISYFVKELIGGREKAIRVNVRWELGL